MLKRRACDRCYRYKEKCDYQSFEARCNQCQRQNLNCTTLRAQPRQGRRPKIKSLGPNSTIQIWEIGTSIVTGRRLIHKHANGYLEKSGIASNYDSRAFRISTPSIYDWNSSSEQLLESSPWIIDQFSTMYDIFMVGPSFAPKFRAAIQESYICSPAILREGFTALADTIIWIRRSTGSLNQAIVLGAFSVEKLRTFRITEFREAFAIVTLGQALAAFDLLTSCNGSRLILRSSLSLIQPWYEEISKSSLLTDPIIITSILWDTIFCLIKRQIPVLKYQPEGHTVDRMAGLCTTLLPIFYDLCVESNKMKYQEFDTRMESIQVRQIENRIHSWKPEPPIDFSTTYSSSEVAIMNIQASIYRTAGLLIIHRIMNPIGTMDDVARLYAHNIMLEISKLEPGTKLQHVTFPILMASLEIHVSPEIWKRIILLSLAPICLSKILSLVNYVWMNRIHGCFLFDIIENGPELVVIP